MHIADIEKRANRIARRFIGEAPKGFALSKRYNEQRTKLASQIKELVKEALDEAHKTQNYCK